MKTHMIAAAAAMTLLGAGAMAGTASLPARSSAARQRFPRQGATHSSASRGGFSAAVRTAAASAGRITPAATSIAVVSTAAARSHT